jgi:hypothetical protein
MHKLHKIALGLLAAAAVATASDVQELKKDTFDAFVKENDIVLAECEYPSHHFICLWMSLIESLR